VGPSGAGESPEHLASPEQMLKLVLDTLAAQRFRFSNVDPSIFEGAAAERITQTPPRVNQDFALS